jgi:phage shock protein PspC (stress-responsive transcriptional regulator)
MKKTVSANIAGTLFNIDDDAYFALENYLRRIEGAYKYTRDEKEILGDLEQRLSELLNDRTEKRVRIVNSDDINWAISVLGKPEDFGATNFEQTAPPPPPNYGNTGSYYHVSRRLYRNPDNKVIGGVCGGLGAYFDADPVLIRVILVVLFFVGFGPLLYIIMWIVVPKAKTATQKCEMHGVPPTPENLRKFS